MKPIRIDSKFKMTRDGIVKEINAIGILPEGVYYQTDKTALVSGRLIKEFAHWDELEPVYCGTFNYYLKGAADGIASILQAVEKECKDGKYIQGVRNLDELIRHLTIIGGVNADERYRSMFNEHK